MRDCKRRSSLNIALPVQLQGTDKCHHFPHRSVFLGITVCLFVSQYLLRKEKMAEARRQAFGDGADGDIEVGFFLTHSNPRSRATYQQTKRTTYCVKTAYFAYRFKTVLSARVWDRRGIDCLRAHDLDRYFHGLAKSGPILIRNHLIEGKFPP